MINCGLYFFVCFENKLFWNTPVVRFPDPLAITVGKPDYIFRKANISFSLILQSQRNWHVLQNDSSQQLAVETSLDGLYQQQISDNQHHCEMGIYVSSNMQHATKTPLFQVNAALPSTAILKKPRERP